MMNAEQAAYFANTPYEARRKWILLNPNVRMREERVIAALIERLAALPPGSRVIEVGCGEGINLQLLQALHSNHDVQYVGYDACIEAVDAGRAAGVDTRFADGLAIPEMDGVADVVFCRDVMHHLPTKESRAAFVVEMERVARPGGRLVVIEPNIFHPLIFLQQLFQPAERGVRAIHERVMRTLLPPTTKVLRGEPSLLWRIVYHYKMPSLVRWLASTQLGRWKLRVWEQLVRIIVPSVFWGYRVYMWTRSS